MPESIREITLNVFKILIQFNPNYSAVRIIPWELKSASEFYYVSDMKEII